MKLNIRGTRLFVDIDGPAIRDGQRFAPLFLLHGGPGANHLRIKRDLGWLRDWFQLVFIDQRGCGQSDKCPEKTLTIADNAEDLEAIRAVLGFEKINVLGWSYGGMLALEYATRYPRRVELLLPLSTAGSGDFIRSSYAWLAKHGTRAQQMAGGKAIRCEAGADFRVLRALDQRRPTPPVPIEWNDAALRIAMQEDLPRWNVLLKLRRVKGPVFLAVGRQDWICPVDQALALKRRLPQAELHIYGNAAHYPATDEPDRFRRDLTRFIRRHAR